MTIEKVGNRLEESTGRTLPDVDDVILPNTDNELGSGVERQAYTSPRGSQATPLTHEV